MLEKRLRAVPAQLFTVNGAATGVVTIADTSLFKVKQHVIVAATSLPNLDFLEIKDIFSPTQMIVGPQSANIKTPYDLSAYTVALGANIFANEQKRPTVPSDDFERACYEEEPTVAKRVVMVDKYGDKYDNDNPLPIAFDGTISVGNVTIQDDDGDELEVNPDGSINVNIVDAVTDSGLTFSHNEISSVASGVETTVITLVGPPGSTRVSKIDVSGDNVALFRVKVNGITIDDKRTYWGSGFNEEFRFEPFGSGVKLDSGDVLTVTVVHNRPMPGSFEATVMYH